MAAGWEVHGNDVYSQSGQLGRVCGMNFSAWQAEGRDPGTRVKPWPSSDGLVAMAKQVLGGEWQ